MIEYLKKLLLLVIASMFTPIIIAVVVIMLIVIVLVALFLIPASPILAFFATRDGYSLKIGNFSILSINSNKKEVRC